MHKRAASAFLILAFTAALSSTVACHKTPTEPTPACSFAVAPTTANIAAGGATVNVTVTTLPSCTWGTATQAAWLSISPDAGIGTAQVSVTAGANAATVPRTGSVIIAAQTVTVTQAGQDPVPPCTYAVEPDRADFPSSGGTGSLTVTTAAGCAWTATSPVPWLVFTSPQAGSGSNAIGYRVEANPDPPDRTAAVSAAGRGVVITQRGDPSRCHYTVTPVDVAPCMQQTELTAAVTTANACPWTATSSATWLEVLAGASGSGSGVVRFRTTDNWELPRLGQILVRWPTVTAGQNVRVAQAGCYYGVSRTSFGIGASAGTFTFDVVQQSDPIACGGPKQNACQWSAVSDAPWISVTTSMPRTGDDPVSFTVASNSTGTTRVGNITVRDQTVRVTQAP